MNDQPVPDNIHILPDQLNDLVDETLGKVLFHEAEISQQLIKDFTECLNKYKTKSIDNINQNSITGFLFESYDFAINLKELLDKYIQEASPQVVDQSLKKLNAEALKFLKLEVEGNVEPIENISLKKLSNNIQDRTRKVMDKVQKKKPANKKEGECYQYFQLIYSVLQNHQDAFGAVEKRILDILLNLWKKSKIIDKNIAILSDLKYDLEAAKDKFTLDADFDDTNKLMQAFIEEGNEATKSIRTATKTAYESLKNNKHIHDENIAKNKRKYTTDQTFKAARTLEKDFKKTRKEWYNTSLALTDDWKLDLEIGSLKYHILKSYFGFIHYIDHKLKTPLDDKMNSMNDFIKELIILFKPDEIGNPEDIITTIKKSKLDFRRKLEIRLIPEIKAILLNSDLPKVVDEFEKNCIKQFETLSKSKLLVKNPVYDHPIDESEMQKISPYDLVSFDMQPEFMEVFPTLKNALIRQLQLLQDKLDEIPEIIDFSIESAIGFYEDKKDISEALRIGGEGIKRATNKIEDLSTLRRDFYKTEVDNMKDKIDRLFEEVSVITDNENALQIKIRITKAKAVEQSKAVRDKIIGDIKNFLPRIIEKVQTLHKFLIESSIKIRKQFEGEITKGFITSDVSDYLVETEEAVNRLPFVYQRLFKLEPLSSTFDLYIERQEAHEKFKLAYSRWKSGKFAPVVISGEKGSGKTSFINRFLSSKSINEEIIFHDLHKEYLEPDSAFNKLIESINEVLPSENENNLDKPKIIVIIDGLEKLFEARINGFNVLQKTMQLISKTNNQIFWIVASHLYSYRYLQRAINIADYFGYHIELEDLTTENLIKIIEKRHNISGFRLQFLPETQKKSFIPKVKQADKRDQQELRDLYFERLQKIVKGNITQAFLFWMRSAAEVTEDVIYINTQDDTRLDFIRSISLSKFEILKNILIHNGISSDKHSQLFRIPNEKSELQLEQMLDDGIIVKRSKFYNINPMIYKQVIDQMYKLNLLH